jgi:CPA1 family monovalent cation:H+ antiporter
MHVFESLLALLFGATVLSVFAHRFGIPYPTMLAMGGAFLAFVPGAPRLNPPPEPSRTFELRSSRRGTSSLL